MVSFSYAIAQFLDLSRGTGWDWIAISLLPLFSHLPSHVLITCSGRCGQSAPSQEKGHLSSRSVLVGRWVQDLVSWRAAHRRWVICLPFLPPLLAHGYVRNTKRIAPKRTVGISLVEQEKLAYLQRYERFCIYKLHESFIKKKFKELNTGLLLSHYIIWLSNRCKMEMQIWIYEVVNTVLQLRCLSALMDLMKRAQCF